MLTAILHYHFRWMRTCSCVLPHTANYRVLVSSNRLLECGRSFLPNQTWLQPPAHAHAMIHDSWCDRVLNISFGRALGQSASAQMQSDQSRLVVRYVNAYNTTVKVSLSGLDGWQAANMTVLQPPANAATACLPHCSGSYYDPATPTLEMCCSNPPGDPSLVSPKVQSTKALEDNAFTAAPFSFTVVLFTKSHQVP